jgi:citrate synthase
MVGIGVSPTSISHQKREKRDNNQSSQMLHSILPRGARNLLRSSAGASRNCSSLKAVLASQMDAKRAELVDMKKKYGHVSLGEVTVDQAIGGARGVKCMLWETSLLDADEGIRFRGHTIPDLQQGPNALPTYSGKEEDEPLPEALIWLLLTGEVPTAEQTKELTEDLHKRAKLPAHVEPMIRAFPDNMHPMTQLSAAILACQTESQFAKAYAEGVSKMDYWETTLDDSLNLIAQLPEIAALIYRCKFHDGKVAAYDSSLDYSANFCRMLGYDNPKFDELMRLYLVIHSDHEGGKLYFSILR